MWLGRQLIDEFVDHTVSERLYFCIGAVLDRVRNKRPLSAEAELLALDNGGIDELIGGNERCWDSPAFQVCDVMHTA